MKNALLESKTPKYKKLLKKYVNKFGINQNLEIRYFADYEMFGTMYYIYLVEIRDFCVDEYQIIECSSSIYADSILINKKRLRKKLRRYCRV